MKECVCVSPHRENTFLHLTHSPSEAVGSHQCSSRGAVCGEGTLRSLASIF